MMQRGQSSRQSPHICFPVATSIPAQAEDRFGGNIDAFDCVQVSTRHKDVKKFLKENKIHLMTNDHHPEEEWWMNTDLSAPTQSTGKSRKESMQRQFGKKKE